MQKFLLFYMAVLFCAQTNAQCLSGNCTTGYGKFKYKNEDIYEGNFADSYANGKGKMFYSGGDTYDGEWKNGYRTGYGTYVWKDGRKYVGYCKDSYWEGQGTYYVNAEGTEKYEGGFSLSKFHGRGVYTFPDGRKYEGNYVMGKKEGKGKFTYADSTYYDGDWKDNKYHGYGTRTLNTGDTYTGQWFNDTINGTGKYTWKTGEVYEGQVAKGARNGTGKNVYANGDVYEGPFINNLREGYGVLTLKNGNKYEGYFKNNVKDGKGKNTIKDSCVYEGDFAEGKYKGKGKITYKSGNVLEAVFDKDAAEGPGKFTSVNGLNFEGRFSAGSYSEGKLYNKNELVYDGKFYGGYPSGKGKYYKNGAVFFEGSFSGSGTYGNTWTAKDGRFINRMYFTDGYFYEIHWLDGKIFFGSCEEIYSWSTIDNIKLRNGYLLQPDGKYLVGEWKNDTLKKIIGTGKFKAGDAGTYYLKGLALYMYKKYSDAQQSFGKAIDKGYKDDSVYLYRGVSFLNSNLNDSAVTWLSTYLSKKAKDKAALLYRARAYKGIKDTVNSIKDYTTIIAIDSKYMEAYWERGYIAYQQKRYQDAIDDFTKCIANLPKENKGDNVYYYRAYAYRDLGNKKTEMCADLQKAKELGNKNAASAITLYCTETKAAGN